LRSWLATLVQERAFVIPQVNVQRALQNATRAARNRPLARERAAPLLLFPRRRLRGFECDGGPKRTIP
jgi:hypothetical protein